MAKIYCLPDHRAVEIAHAETILSALLADDIPQTHVCGGNAFCSTCRIMILDGAEHCSPLTATEKTLAKKLDFPVHIRLACQTQVSGDVAIRRMVLDNTDVDIVENQISVGSIGSQRSVAIMYARIRGVTNFDEVNFPYDIIDVMSRYFHRMKQVVSQYGGIINNYTGLGLVAIFGLEHTEQVCDRATWAGLGMLRSVKELNGYLEQLSYHPLNLSIGIHYGPAVLVPVDPTRSSLVSAIGKAVSFVGKVEAANQDLKTELLVSEAVFDRIRDHAVVNQTSLLNAAGDRDTVYEIVAMQGDPPAKVESSSQHSLAKRLSDFLQKFANSWGN